MKMLILKKLQITVPQESEIEGNVIFRALCLLWPAYISEEEGRSFYTQQTRMSILSLFGSQLVNLVFIPAYTPE